MLTGRIGAKNLCHLSTYFGFMTTFYVLQTVYPQLLFGYVFLSWMVSAIYLKITPFPLWVKARLMVEATKIPQYYKVILEGPQYVTGIQTLSSSIMVTKIHRIIENAPHAQQEQCIYLLDEALTRIGFNANLIGVSGVLLSIIVTYTGIALSYQFLQRNQIFRRIII